MILESNMVYLMLSTQLVIQSLPEDHLGVEDAIDLKDAGLGPGMTINDNIQKMYLLQPRVGFVSMITSKQ